MPATSRSMCLAYRSKPSHRDLQNPPKTNSPALRGRPASATLPFLPTALPIFSAVRPVDIPAATTSFSWAQSRPMPTTVRSPCCLLAVVTADLLLLTTFQGPTSLDEKQSLAQACSRQAE